MMLFFLAIAAISWLISVRYEKLMIETENLEYKAGVGKWAVGACIDPEMLNIDLRNYRTIWIWSTATSTLSVFSMILVQVGMWGG